MKDKTTLIIDVLLYLALFALPFLIFSILKSAFGVSTIQSIGELQSFDKLQEFEHSLWTILFSLIGAIALAVFGPLILFALSKQLIWRIHLRKQIDFAIVWRSVVLMLLIWVIIAIPFVLNFARLIAQQKVGALSLSQFIPLGVIILLGSYFSGLASAFLAKTGKIKSAISLTFRKGFKRPILLLPSLAYFVALIITAAMLRSLNSSPVVYGVLLLLTAVFVSYFGRLFIAKQISSM